jgi:hypothetical protein
MNALILTSEQRDQALALNASGDAKRELRPAALKDGRFALNADLLTDIGQGQTWEHYKELVGSLAAEQVGLGSTGAGAFVAVDVA